MAANAYSKWQLPWKDIHSHGLFQSPKRDWGRNKQEPDSPAHHFPFFLLDLIHTVCLWKSPNHVLRPPYGLPPARCKQKSLPETWPQPYAQSKWHHPVIGHWMETKGMPHIPLAKLSAFPSIATMLECSNSSHALGSGVGGLWKTTVNIWQHQESPLLLLCVSNFICIIWLMLPQP